MVIPPFDTCEDFEACKPQFCICGDNRNVTLKVEYLNRLICDEPATRVNCTCSVTDEVTKDLFEDMEDVWDCGPTKCGCSDGTEVEVKKKKKRGRKGGKKGGKHRGRRNALPDLTPIMGYMPHLDMGPF